MRTFLNTEAGEFKTSGLSFFPKFSSSTKPSPASLQPMNTNNSISLKAQSNMEIRNSTISDSVKDDDDDRISSLPDCILHLILSFFDMKHVVQTSVLSKRWRDLWTSLHILNFNIKRHSFEAVQEKEYMDFIDRVLVLRNSSTIQRFSLICHENYDDIYCVCDVAPRLTTWILAALRRNVQQLYLEITVDSLYQFPCSFFTCKSLKILELSCCGPLRPTFIPPDSVSLPKLETMILDGFLFQFEDNDLINKFFSSCPVMESLTISDCSIHHINLNISSVKLKHFAIDISVIDFKELGLARGSIKLCAPNLVSFQCIDYSSKRYFLENLSSLAKAEVNIVREEEGEELDEELYNRRMMKFLKALRYVKDLSLTSCILEDVSGASHLLQSTQFCYMRCLKLYTWISRDCIMGITYLLKLCPNIETIFLKITPSSSVDPMNPYWDEKNLNLAYLGDYWKTGMLSEFMLPHLKLVEIHGVQGFVSELKFLEILLKYALVLEKVLLFTCIGGSLDEGLQLMEFSRILRTFPKASSRLTVSFF